MMTRTRLALIAVMALVASSALASARADTLELECHNGRTGRVTTSVKVASDGKIATKGEAGPVTVTDKQKVARWMAALKDVDFNAVSRELKRIPRDASFCWLQHQRGKRGQKITFRTSQLEEGSARAVRIGRIVNELREYDPKK